MKKGIRCLDYNEIGRKNQTTIDYYFVTGDEEIPSHVCVSLGDVDPMTGEKITDVTFSGSIMPSAIMKSISIRRRLPRRRLPARRRPAGNFGKRLPRILKRIMDIRRIKPC